MNVLERIVATKRAELAAGPPPDLPPLARARAARPDAVVGALARAAGAPLRLLAEVKFASPSAGPLSRSLDAGQRAAAYASGGAALVSVLCDRTYFDGSYGDLARARAALDEAGSAVPLLAKEFIVDAAQLEWARAAGADAALLIVRILGVRTLRALLDRARQLDLEPFVEVASDEERDLALDAGARVVGVNARDLDTLIVDPERAAHVLAGVPPDRIAIHLSGIASTDSLRAVAGGRADGALVGEALMRAPDPGPLLRDFVRAAGGG